MASLVPYSLNACTSLKKSSNTFSIIKTGNAGHLSNLVITKSQNPISGFFQLSLGGKKCLNVGKKTKEDQWRVWYIDDGSCGIAPQPQPPPSALDLIQDFYSSINDKDTEKLEQLLSENCLFLDLIFYIPFDGKQSIIKFVSDLIDAMGPNIHFVMDSIAEGENCTVTVLWHLEWKQKEIPFTTGCSFFECEEVNGKLFIRKITGVEEFPVKPGDLVLKLLKAASIVFDRFPIAAEGLLLKSHGTHEGVLMLLDMLDAYRKRSS